ncbi:SusC/RagA family TonB-linked outer membrane protein [Muricauda sp. HICW]|uniref:SusC/RagA family TonB-linked outer membrane protein n=1 Tax=Flagellimonas chongwuensis TaxID=2697365 RepID=A0A850ND19_9FLAO|nr:TonB-dependent receptor [Allomuricauda chongwuensis]NVN19041.1 SusC/RagA family TonB-linked outer membrane protein [Allomuricauda chongwuensis]
MRILFLTLLWCCIPISHVWSQQHEVQGTVTAAEDGMPLPGASILVKGSTNGTMTDFDGNYVLADVPQGSVLVFSYVGFLSQEVTVNDQSTLNIALKADAQQLDEVVITGYVAEKKADLTGAVSIVDIAPIKETSMSSGSPIQAMQGRVAGLFVQKSGDPTGSSNQILIRGVNTLGNNAPLYVIDGVPTVRQEVFSSINPSTIASIQVLKDASASSLYGSRASNGVIIITTKNVSKGEKVNVSFSSNLSVLSEKKQRYDMLNAKERGRVLWQASVNDGSDPNTGYGEIYNFDWNGDFNNPVLNNVSVQPYVGGDSNVPSGDTDWQDTLYETGFVLNNDLTVSGGDDKAFALLNLGYLDNTGILKYSGYERYSAKINASLNLFNDHLKIGTNTQFYKSNETLASRDVGNAPTPGLGINMAPTIPVYTSTGDYGGPLGSGYSDRNNPLYMQYINRWDNTARTTIFGNVYAELKILENLTFRTSIGLDHYRTDLKDIEPRVSNGFITRTLNSLEISQADFSSLVLTNTLQYNFTLNEDHRFNVLLGTESIKNKLHSVTATAQNFAVEDESYYVLSAATGQRTNQGSITEDALLSQFGKINYTFSDKYLASVTLRRDGSSKFGTDNRYAIFPAFTVGWRMKNENFLKDKDWLNTLKLRAGYGVVGNQFIGDYARFGLYEPRYGPVEYNYAQDSFSEWYNVGTAYDINGNNSGNLPAGFISIQSENPSLKWEETKEINVGVDFGFFNRSIVGSFDYFTRNTDGILIRPPIASAVGEGRERWLNGASTKTNGWELILSYNHNFENDFKFGVTTNFGAFRDKITSLPEEARTAYPGTAQNSIIGHSQFSIFGYKTEGLFQSQEEVNEHPTGGVQVGNARPGGIKIVDVNGDGVINSNDRDWLGTTLPKLEYGITIDAHYKNFDASIFGSGVMGRIGVDPYIMYNNFVPGRENAATGTLNGWTPTNTNTNIPSLSLVNNFTENSDYIYRNNSYFKIRNIQLGYSLPQDLIEKWGGMTGLRIYLQAENLFWFTPKGYIGADPERVDINAIPVPSIMSIGFNVNF